VREVEISTPEIRLGSFLKWAGVAATGGGAKEAVASGSVRVNGALETRRGRRLRAGDRVEVGGEVLLVRRSGD
jgi:ribosome-associated protein